MNRLMNNIASLSQNSTRMASSFAKVSHVIFDMDGLLLDTETLYSKVTQTILDPYGKTYTWDVKVTLMGLQGIEVAKRIVDIYELPMTPEEYRDLSIKIGYELMANAEMLPDTESIYEKMIADIAKKYDREYPWDVRMRILGTTEQRTAEIAVNDLKLPIATAEFTNQFNDLGRKRLGEATLLRGVEKFLKHLHDENVPFALATSSSKEMMEIKSKNHQELFNLFHHKVMGSSDPEVKQGKPSPDIFLVAARRFPDNPDPAKCLVFEDAPNGVTAAVSAGMQVVMVPHESVSRDLCKDATLVLNSLTEFKPEDFGLPPYKN